jgi:hypothetical protein
MAINTIAQALTLKDCLLAPLFPLRRWGSGDGYGRRRPYHRRMIRTVSCSRRTEDMRHRNRAACGAHMSRVQSNLLLSGSTRCLQAFGIDVAIALARRGYAHRQKPDPNFWTLSRGAAEGRLYVAAVFDLFSSAAR